MTPDHAPGAAGRPTGHREEMAEPSPVTSEVESGTSEAVVAPLIAGDLRLSPGPRTADGRIRVEGRAPRDARWVWLEIRAGEEKEHRFLPVRDGKSWTQDAWLRFGPGVYEVRVLAATTGDEPYGQRYSRLARFTVRNDEIRELRHVAPSARVESDDPRIVELAERLTEGASDDDARARALHRWVVESIEYDVEAFLRRDLRSVSAVQTMQAKRAVCSGYANLLAALARAAGIPARVVLGYARRAELGESWESVAAPEGFNHAWNELLIEGRWVTIDATWNAGSVDLIGRRFIRDASERYYDPAPEVLARDHRTVKLAAD